MIRQAIKIMWKKRRQNIFLLFELLLSFLILFGVSTLVITQMRKYKQPLGFKSENVATAFIEFGDLQKQYQYAEGEGYDTVRFEQKLEQLKLDVLDITGIDEASYSINVLPFNNSTWGGGNETDEEGMINYKHSYILFGDEDYGKVLEPELSSGRWFEKEDILAKDIPVVVNELFVKENVKADQKVIGGKLRTWGKVHEIIGVVKNFKFRGEFYDETQVIIPLLKQSNIINTLLVKFDSSVNPNWEFEFQQALESSLPNVSFFQYQLEESRRRSSKKTWIMIYGLLGLGLFLVINVAMGIFGMLQYTIRKRVGEIGLRKAIGAGNGIILSQFMVEMLILATMAVLLGIFLAVQVPLLKLFEMENVNFYYAILATTLFIYLVVILCSLIPSIQASRIRPSIALHDNG